MGIFSVEQLEEMRHRPEFDGVPVPSTEELEEAQAGPKLTGRLESWFARHNAGFISSAVGRFEFSSRDIIGGEPRLGSTVLFEIKWPGDRRGSGGTAGNVEIESKV